MNYLSRTSTVWTVSAAIALSSCTAALWGQATATATISNKTMAVRLNSSPGKTQLSVEDLLTRRSIELSQLFSVTLQNGSVLKPANLQLQSGYTNEAIPATSDHLGGNQVCADWHDQKDAADFHWCLIVRPESSYLRTKLTIQAADQDLGITEVRLLDFKDAEAHVSGTVKGSPVVDGQMFFGFEHPLSWTRVESGNVQAGVSRVLPLQKNQSVTYSAVIGTAHPGQMRRDFLAYIEAERPRPYKPFLHYNSWFDIGYENRYSEADALDRVHVFGEELVDKRHVTLSSFLFDDGWDDPKSFWGFDSGFPNGFTKVAEATAKIHAGVGVWLSPWGGYAEQKRERILYGKQHGYEIIHDGFALSGPKYFDGFSKVCLEMVDRYNVNQFKFDGTGNADRVFPGSAFDSDFDAAIHLIHRIREEKPGIFINLTTGTYPSPFWLFDADSIWRGGEDSDFAGVGTSRQRWITYRDEQTYRNIVLGGPLFPLNSLMLHGLIFAKQAKGLDSDPHNDFPDEVHSYFGSGTQLQEMYITPSLLSKTNWDILANAANWSREKSSILKDVHWIGGDPGKLQVYGWAAWSPEGWIVTLRNPSNVAQDYQLNLKDALELPEGVPTSFLVEQPFEENHPAQLRWQATKSVTIHLKPFEVHSFESDTPAARP